MALLMEAAIILGVTLTGEMLHALLPLPVPAGIYGMVLMLLLLMSGILKIEKIKRAGSFFIEIMPVMFIPAAAGLMEIVPQLRGALLPIAVVVVITTVIVMAASGLTAQLIIRREAAKEHE